MNTHQILGYLDCILSKQSCTYSVLPCNYLKKLKVSKYPLYLVVNTAPSSHSGLHWIAMYRASSKSPLIFLDSYGLDTSSYGKTFSSFVKSCNVKVIEADKRLQDFNSNVCGHYAIYFIYQLFRMGCLKTLYNGFSNDPGKNDRKVKSFVRKRVCKTRCKKPTLNQCCTKFCK